mmetsp:Transcript_38904/g.90066  ORF Transcript_38904/g.90066 Transcript_38904/m.90066 type:complete len:536 (-) Transcript_38904:8-1615(-)
MGVEGQRTLHEVYRETPRLHGKLLRHAGCAALAALLVWCCCCPFQEAFALQPGSGRPSRSRRRVLGQTESAEDWRDFRARLVQGSGRELSKDWAYSTDLLEKGSVILSVPGDYWTLRRQYFSKVVMLIIDHDEDGTVGVVLNRPTQLNAEQLDLSESDLPTDGILEFFGWSKGLEEWPVWFGGDCEGLECPQRLPRHFCMHTLDRLATSSNEVIKGIYIMSFRQAKFMVMTGQAKREDFLLFVGYTGWSAGQLQDELNRGESWVLGAANRDLLLGAGSSEEPLSRRMRAVCGSEGPEHLGDGTALWDRLFNALRPKEASNLEQEEEQHNNDMIRMWVDAYLRPPLFPATTAYSWKVSAGRILRGSATQWLLGRPVKTWPARSKRKDQWMVPGQYLHKAVLLLLGDCFPGQVASLVLLNGPKIAYTQEGQEVWFGGPSCVQEEARCLMTLPGGGAIVGRFSLLPGVFHQLLGDGGLEIVKDVKLEEILRVPGEERWVAAGGTLDSLKEVTTAMKGDRQQKKWYKEFLGVSGLAQTE